MHPTTRRRRTAALAVAAATLLTVLSGAPEAVGQSVGNLRTGENYRLGNPPAPRLRDTPGLAANPADPGNIVEVEFDTLAVDCHVNVSLNGGATWTGRALVPPAGFPPPRSPTQTPSCTSFEGSVAWGSGQNVYVAHSSGRPNQGSSAIVSRSSDGGRNWVPAVAMNTAAAAPSYIGPELAVHRGGGTGGADRVYVMAQANVSVGGANLARIFVAVSNDGGVTWSAPVDASGGGTTTALSRAEPSAPVVMSDGSVAVAYRVPDPNPPAPAPTALGSTLQIGRSIDGGVTWNQFNAARVSGFVDEIDRRFNGSIFPRMAGDARNNNLYLTYMEGPPPGGRQDHFIHPDVDVMFTRSLDGGLTWSAPKRINDDPPGSGNPGIGPAQRHPKPSVSPDGRVDVVWHDRRHGYRSPVHAHLGNGEARMGDTYFAYSLDAGNTFSKNRRISDKTQNLDIGGDHYANFYWNFPPALVELGTDEILFAWQDSREGNFDNENTDIFLGKLNLRAPDPIPVQRLEETRRSSLSVALSRYSYVGGAQGVLDNDVTNRPVTRPVIVNEGDAAGALAGAVLARAHLGPLLASPASGLTPELTAEVRRMSPFGAFLIGGDDALAPTVKANLVSAGILEARIERYSGSPAEIAKAVAVGMDRRSDAQRAAAAPAFDAAVVVDPASPEAFAAAGMAASLRLPILFSDKDSVPGATREALAALNITNTLVVGGSAVLSDALFTSLPGAKRLGGVDPIAVSRSVLAESVARRLPVNIVHVVASERPFDAALTAAAVARVGGLLLLAPGADVDFANRSLGDLGLRSQVDRLVVAQSTAASGGGYRLVARDGGIFAFGGAGFFGSAANLRLARPMVSMAATPSNLGYWTVAADGGVFAFGDARFRGSTGGLRLAQPVVGMARTPSGNGYWLVAQDGGVFAFGDARFLGSMGGARLARPIVGMAPTPTGRGYWLVAADGGVFSFGDAAFRGSTGAMRLAQPMVGMAPGPSGNGYWLVARDGGVFAFGDAAFKGSTGAIRLAQPMVGMASSPSGNGYLLTAADGGVFAFGDAVFAGSTGAMRLNQAVVGLSVGGP